MKLPKDLRRMNEEQFVKAFNILKSKTKNFREFPPELLIENNQFLVVIRCCLNLSQKELAKKLNCTKDWVRHTEAGRNKIMHPKIAERWARKFENLLDSTNISLDKSLEFWYKLQFARAQDFPEVKIKRKSILKLNEKELRKWFRSIQRKTNNFTNFGSKILVENPQNILIFRLVLGLDHRTFAKSINKCSRGLRRWEHLEMKMKPQTAKDVMRNIRSLFLEISPEIIFKRVLFNFRVLTNRFGHRNLDAMFSRGLNFAKNQELSDIEKEISVLFEKEQIPFEMHAIVDGLKRKFNVDFAIPNGRNPKILMETFDFSLKGKTPSHSKMRICHIDHRFQMIKARHPKVQTILAIRFNGRPIHETLVRKSLEIEILNTDHLIINHLSDILPVVQNM